MQDALGRDLSVGDEIAYATRRSSSMEIKQTKILKILKKTSWSNSEYEVAICKNPAYISIEDQKAAYEADRVKDKEEIERLKSLDQPIPRWLAHQYNFYPTYHPKTVQLSVPGYIVKI